MCKEIKDCEFYHEIKNTNDIQCLQMIGKLNFCEDNPNCYYKLLLKSQQEVEEWHAKSNFFQTELNKELKEKCNLQQSLKVANKIISILVHDSDRQNCFEWAKNKANTELKAQQALTEIALSEQTANANILSGEKEGK